MAVMSETEPLGDVLTTLSGRADDQVNGHLFDWIFATKHPLGVRLAEFAHRRRRRRRDLRASRVPRDQKQEADGPTNLVFRHCEE